MANDIDFASIFEGLAPDEAQALAGRLREAIWNEVTNFQKGATMPADGQQSPEAQAERQEQERLQLEAELITRRKERLEREAFQRMTPAERAAYDRDNDPQQIVKQFYGQAREQEEREFLAQLEKEKNEKLIQWRNAHPGQTTTLERTNAIRKIEEGINAKAQAWMKEREARELAAEVLEDNYRRLTSSLSPRGRQILCDLIDQAPPMAQRVEAAKGTVQQSRQAELYAAFVQEVKNSGARGNHAWIANIRAKYAGQGLDPNYSG